MSFKLSPEGFIAFYPCVDLEATRHFYETVLGLELVRDQKTCFIFKTAQEAFIGFCKHEDVSPHKGLIITLLTDKVDEVYEHLKNNAIETEHEPSLNEYYGIYHFFAKDPNGYRLEVQRFIEPL